MRASVDFSIQVVSVEFSTNEGVVEAGWLGFLFAFRHPKLVKDGWTINYWPVKEDRLRSPDFGSYVQIYNNYDIAELIKAGPKKECCRPPCCDGS